MPPLPNKSGTTVANDLTSKDNFKCDDLLLEDKCWVLEQTFLQTHQTGTFASCGQHLERVSCCDLWISRAFTDSIEPIFRSGVEWRTFAEGPVGVGKNFFFLLFSAFSNLQTNFLDGSEETESK